MPGYKTHDTIGVVITVPASLAVGVYSGATAALIFAIAILWSTFYLSPDLDLHSRIYRRWGMLRFIWIPYQKIIPHRSIWSHCGISVLLRILYLYSVIQFCYWLTGGSSFLLLSLWYSDYANLCLYCLCGAILADSAHVLADRLYSAVHQIF